MTTRRHLLLAGGAALALGATRARAQDAQLVSALRDDSLAPQLVSLSSSLPPGEIHLDPQAFRLYLTLPDGLAIRYAVGVGRPGLYEAGSYTVGAKKEWPSWTPTPEMIEREPEKYLRYADGMPGGIDNPLGARALYLFQEGRGDTFLRIHGTNDPGSIGTAVSNGCARLVNEDAIDLYERVPLGTPVFLYPQTPV